MSDQTIASNAAFEARLHENAQATADILDLLVSEHLENAEISRPERLVEAMRHGVLNGGKRLRPFLVVETARLFGEAGEGALRVAAALECVHCYSLIHDDLPAMDDDRLRRGQPTVHIAFDEATAILAGDALLTLAFAIIASPQTNLPPETRLQLVSQLAQAAGVGGMAGGQALDLASENRRLREGDIVTMQAMKTGALLRFACEAGAIIARAGQHDRVAMRRFGELTGRAFQLADDLLDLTARTETLGKIAGKDSGRGKATLVALHGEAWARLELERLTQESLAILADYGTAGDMLAASARFIARRNH